MADEDKAAGAPAAEAAVAAPVDAAVTPAAAAPVAVVDAAAAAKPELTTDVPSLLETATAPDKPDAEPAEESEPPADAKPDDKAKPEGDKPDKAEAKDGAKPEAEAKPAEAETRPAPEPVEYKYTLPETLKLDEALKGEVHAVFDAFRDHPDTGAQGLVDLHSKLVTQAIEQVRADQHRVFNDMRADWRKEIMSDPELGGAGHQTAMKAVARMRDLLAKDMLDPRKYDDGSPRLSEFEEFLRVTGAGDHPVFARLLHNAARIFDEPALPPQNINPTPYNGKLRPARLRDLYSNGPGQS